MSRAEDTSRPMGPPERDAYDWVARFASGEASRTDIDELKQWAARDPGNAERFDRASAAWHAVGLAASGAAPGAVPRPARSAGLSRRLLIGGALAASAATVFFVRPPLDLWPSLTDLTADYRTDVGERRQVKLSDDVAVEMNTRTSISALSSKSGDTRFELLTGEALVTAPAETDKTLTVVAGNGRIVARNARFNVRRDAEAVCVTCLAGETTVERDATRRLLSAGEQIAYTDRGFGPTSTPDIATVTAWQGGLLVFRAMPVSEVVHEINRYRRGRVILANAALGQERFSARFRIENVDQVVHQIEEIFHARVTSLPGGVVLLS